MRRQTRSLRRIWSDQKPFHRRARLYEGNEEVDAFTLGMMPFRVEFTDEHGVWNRFFKTRETALKWYNRFAELCSVIPEPAHATEHPFKPRSPGRVVQDEIIAAGDEGK